VSKAREQQVLSAKTCKKGIGRISMEEKKAEVGPWSGHCVMEMALIFLSQST
jgi:hypothetical protein